MALSSEQYGYALAKRVLEYLLQYGAIRHEHYGYCGVGFVIVDHTILYTHFDEWLTYTAGRQYVPGGDYIGIIKRFDNPQHFIALLSEQSDLSLHGAETDDPWYAGNQRITKKRLLSVIARLTP